jgi:hypothetical protein
MKACDVGFVSQRAQRQFCEMGVPTFRRQKIKSNRQKIRRWMGSDDLLAYFYFGDLCEN